jgi:hypothetical protein
MRFSTASPHAAEAGCPSGLLLITFGQNVIVVDASVLAVALGDDGTDGRHARERLADETLVAPELVDLEVAAVWRRHVAPKTDGRSESRKCGRGPGGSADACLSCASGVYCEVEAIGEASDD